MTAPRFRPVAWLVLAALLCTAVPASAQVRAWLDRSRTVLGQAVTLNLESERDIPTPDLAPLKADFDVVDTSSSNQMQVINGRVSRTVLLAITLQPRRTGELLVPALQVGATTTPALGLRVADAPLAQPGSSDVFIQTEVDDEHPYVQQTVGVTVRLFYGVPLISGQLDLDAPDGISLQRVGDDVQSQREVAGRRYTVVERHFQLVPDRSGPLQVPAAHFSGRGAAGGWFDTIMGNGDRSALSATGRPVTLQVRAQPDNAPQPWLPLHGLELAYAQQPRDAMAGQATTMVVQATARGATRAQMPALPTPSVAGAQVFAEPPDYQESFDGTVPVVRMTRRYSIVPNGAGTLVLPGLAMDWFDVASGQARTARLPDLDLKVAAGTGSFAGAALPAPAPAATAGAADGQAPTGPGLAVGDTAPASAWAAMAGNARLWMGVATVFALLWLVTLAWLAWGRAPARAAAPAGRVPPRVPRPSAVMPPPPRSTHGLPDLRRALDTGTLDEVADALRGMAPPPTPDLDAVVARLADPAQREAVQALRRARWAGGDGPQARERLRQAFAHGPAWTVARTADPADGELPPLYPRR